MSNARLGLQDAREGVLWAEALSTRDRDLASGVRFGTYKVPADLDGRLAARYVASQDGEKRPSARSRFRAQDAAMPPGCGSQPGGA